MGVDETREAALRRQNAALGALSRSGLLSGNDRTHVFRGIAEVAARTLGVGRTSLWLYSPDRERLVCVDLFELAGERHTAGSVIERSSYPAYFAALEHSRAVAATDAKLDPRTSEFAEDYLAPLGIGAMLDAPIVVGGSSIGVVCHEHVGGPRSFSEEEIAFAGSLADFAALALETEQRRLVEERLRAREEELRLALDAARMGTWSWDIATGSIHWSDRVGGIFGLEEGYQPRDFEDFAGRIHPEDRDSVVSAIEGSVSGRLRDFAVVHRMLRPDGNLRFLECHGLVKRREDGSPERMMGTILDVTDRRRLEDQLQHSQKMESIGRLAGGVAHDFNNLLTAILGFAQLLSREVGDSTTARSHVRLIEEAALRAAGVTGQLLAFARKQPTKPRIVDVGALVRNLASLLRRLIGEDVRLVVEAADVPMLVRIDPVQLEQVIVNLAVNARDAMPRGGVLTIRVHSRSLTTDEAAEHAEATPGEYVLLSVSDTGVGMTSNTLAHVFEPFFTTKEPGKGTGLGLSTCYGIARQAGGHIEVRSSVGEGSTFEVFLPRELEAREADVDRPSVPGVPRGSGTVLLVEDESLVRDLAATVLEEAGYEVLVADGPEQALALAADAAQRIDLVVTDVVMPDRGGPELVEALRAHRPGLGALFVSGYSAGLPSARDALPPGARLLPKPFTPQALAEEVQKLVAGSGRPAAGRSDG
ncbi:MAG: ATP-binding protein [Polyangiales bacterium]